MPLGLAAWALTYYSGVHATVAGVAMGLLLRATAPAGDRSSAGDHSAHLLARSQRRSPLFALFPRA